MNYRIFSEQGLEFGEGLRTGTKHRAGRVADLPVPAGKRFVEARLPKFARKNECAGDMIRGRPIPTRIGGFSQSIRRHGAPDLPMVTSTSTPGSTAIVGIGW